MLNLKSPVRRSPRVPKAAKIWLGIGLLVAVLGIGSTFASTIAINGGTVTEFGQGVERTVFCGGSQSITVAPITTYRNSSVDSTAGTFWLSGIVVSNVPNACDGIDFEFSVYNTNAGGSALAMATVPLFSISAVTPTVYWRATGSSLPSVDSSRKSSFIGCQSYESSNNSGTYGGLLSLSNTSYSDPCAVAYLTNVTATSFQINLHEGILITNLDVNTNNMSRIVVQTQPDTFGASALNSGTYGLVNS
jgi:hypothetical protein